MGSKRMDSLRDLDRWGCVFRVECRRCGHKAELTAWDLQERALKLRDRAMEWSRLAVIGARLRCSQCGARKARWGVAERWGI